MRTFSLRAIKYFNTLKEPGNLPADVTVMNPYKHKGVKVALKEFFEKYFDDKNERLFILGINLGRFGGGLTGIPFTDPVALKNYCTIENNLGSNRELSSKFIYDMISAFGGTEKFYSKVFISALYPFAITKDGKNYNYYDDKELYCFLKPEIIKSLSEQMKFGSRKDIVVCLGKKNAKFLNEINKEEKLFKDVVVLDHPRYIMQYKLKQKDDYIQKYLDAINDPG